MKIKTIDIQAKEWLDKTYGNSYFSAQIIINFGMESQSTLYIPYEYGYGDYYLQASQKLLISLGYIPTNNYCLTRQCRDELKIILRYSKQKGCLKREMISFGKGE